MGRGGCRWHHTLWCEQCRGLCDQPDEEREEVLKMYAESLDLRQKQLKTEIEENKELNDLDKAIDFMASVDNGQTKLETLPE